MHFAVHRRHGSEQVRRLVHEMTAEVEEDPAANRTIAALPPPRLQLRPPPLEARLEPVYPAEVAVFEHTSQRQQLGVPATVLVRRQQHTALPSKLHQAGRV